MHIFYMFYINIVIKKYNYTSGFSKNKKQKRYFIKTTMIFTIETNVSW